MDGFHVTQISLIIIQEKNNIAYHSIIKLSQEIEIS